MEIRSIHHIQLAMPKGCENNAIGFYQDLLGLPNVAKPAALAHRGGVWFENGAVRVHLGVEDGFAPAQKAHPAFEVRGLHALLQRLESQGVEVQRDDTLAQFARAYVFDPFGNRIELLEPKATS